MDSDLVLVRLSRRALFSRMLPVELPNSSSNASSNFVKLVFSLSSFYKSYDFLCSNSGLSWLITIESNLLSNPDLVTE